MSDLQRAIEIAVEAHRGQSRRDGSPYILHPLRLMMSVNSSDAKMVAILHDVVEDCDVSFADIEQEGFPPHVVEALKLVTHEAGVGYDDYIRNIKPNALAREVKLADLRDNSNIHELPEVRSRDLERMEKYHRAYKFLVADDAD